MTDLSFFHPVVRQWFEGTFGKPTPPQEAGWPEVAAGKNVLILAPTGSGKTLAAFLQCLNWLYEKMLEGHRMEDGVRVLYISPLKALNNDVHRNLEVPLAGIQAAAQRMGMEFPALSVGLRTGDTPAKERQRMLRKPPQILITTPESLFLLLASKQRQILTTVRFVIVDEIHSVFPTKRGTHLSLSLEYLQHLVKEPFQRIGLSATLRPLDKAAEFLGGGVMTPKGWIPRPVEIIDSGGRKDLDLGVDVPVPNLKTLPEKTIWPAIYRYLLDQVKRHTSTLIFVNNRRVAERVATNLNELAGYMIARVHHGSLSKESREEVETLLKEGKLKCLVATSSLELGIDVGSIDLVLQVESPHEVARGLQRVGRAGHVLNLPSKGRIVVKTRDDLLEAAVVCREMATRRVEAAKMPTNCLDVLAQQIVGMTAAGPLGEEQLLRIVQGAAGYRTLKKQEFESVLAMLSGQFGADEIVELRPRVYWDRVNGKILASEGGKRLVYTSGGTIPDRGYFGVYAAGSNVRIGELEEEFVYERRIGDQFVLGTSILRVEEIRQDRVIVTHGRGAPTIPFWKGEGFGRPYELGLSFGRFLSAMEDVLHNQDLEGWLRQECFLDRVGAANLAQYIQEQKEATGVLPTDRRIIIEEFPDELGEWRIVIHSVFGERVNKPLALLIEEQVRKKYALELAGVNADNGVMFVAPAGPEPPIVDLRGLGTEDIEKFLAERVGTTVLFGSLFRENAGRALILPRKGLGRKRTPFWLSRLKAEDLLQVVQKYPNFPVVMETYRQILAEAFDIHGLRQVLKGLRTGAIQVERRRGHHPSPFAHPLVFGLNAAYLYEPDVPRAEKRLHALALDHKTLKNLMSGAELRQLLDPEVIEKVAAQASGLDHKPPVSPDELHAWLLRRGDWLVMETDLLETIGCVKGDDPTVWQQLDELKSAGRVKLVEWHVGDRRQQAWIAAELAAEYEFALFAKDNDAVDSLIKRFARVHGPFAVNAVHNRYGLEKELVEESLRRLQSRGLVQSGEFTPGGIGEEWCDIKHLQSIHRRSLAKARRAVKARPPEDYAAFLLRWQGLGAPGSIDALSRTLAQLSGFYFPSELWEGFILPARVKGYNPVQLDQLLAGGLASWKARGMAPNLEVAVQATGGAAYPSGTGTGPTIPRERQSSPQTVESLDEAARKILSELASRGALSIPQIWQYTGIPVNTLLLKLEELMGMGLVTNDSFGPVRYFQSAQSAAARRVLESGKVIGPAVLSQMGRWSMTDASLPGDGELAVESTAEALLSLYGVVTKEVASLAGCEWGPLRDLLSEWEMAGRVKRGLFVQDLSGRQYATTAAVEGIRLARETGLPKYLAVAFGDPANAWGRILPWPGPRRPRDRAIIISQGGIPVLAAEGRRLSTLSNSFAGGKPLSGSELRDALAEMVRGLLMLHGRTQRIELTEWNDGSILDSDAAEILREFGFERDYKGLTKWREFSLGNSALSAGENLLREEI